jgi:hypothetical protein
MRFRGGEFSTGTMGNFQPELTFRDFAAPERATRRRGVRGFGPRIPQRSRR